MDAYKILGLKENALEEVIRKAYHTLVKKYHPDLYTDPKEKLEAQDKLVQLNLAYREALSHAADRSRGYVVMPPERAWERARAYIARQDWERALVQLSHIEDRDLEWYRTQGDILMALKQYSSALQAYKICVKLAPEDQESHRRCLDAAVTLRRHQTLPYRISDWAQGLLRKK